MRKRQVTIGHQSCRVFATYSLPGVHAAYHGCVHKALQTQPLSLNTMPLRPLPHPLDLGCQDSTLSLSTSFLFFLQQHTSHLPPTTTSLSAPLRLHLLLSRLSPLLSPREPESGCLLALWTGPLQHHNGQPTRPPGTLHDIRATLSAHTGQALPCGHLASSFQSSQAVMVACVHTGTQTLAPASVSQDMSLALSKS